MRQQQLLQVRPGAGLPLVGGAKFSVVPLQSLLSIKGKYVTGTKWIQRLSSGSGQADTAEIPGSCIKDDSDVVKSGDAVKETITNWSLMY